MKLATACFDQHHCRGIGSKCSSNCNQLNKLAAYVKGDQTLKRMEAVTDCTCFGDQNTGFLLSRWQLAFPTCGRLRGVHGGRNEGGHWRLERATHGGTTVRWVVVE